MIVRVVMSRTTRVPAVSFSLSTLLRHPTTYLGPLLALTITAILHMKYIDSQLYLSSKIHVLMIKITRQLHSTLVLNFYFTHYTLTCLFMIKTKE
ncbi:hypothetical protein Hanom_Chr03g00230231 [Helianthus anomalus]